MRVFHFMRKEYAKQNIEKSRLKVATLNNMNDPYEFYLQLEGATKEQVENFKNHYNTKAGFLCFTRRLGDPVQWAHYADNHRGVCMEFDIPEHYLQKVKYLKSPVLISAKNASWKQDLVNATLCKYRGWKYEREYRVAIYLESDGVAEENGLYFTHFSEKFTPTKIYTGIRCQLSGEESDVFKNAGLPIIQMKQDSKSYQIIRA